MVRHVFWIALLTLAGPVWAQSAPAIDIPALAAAAARRWPQPVRVGDLLGKDVVKPVEAQPVLGHVAAVSHRPDGGLNVIVDYGGLFGVGAHPIAVPVEAMALIGPYLTVEGFTPEQLDGFPTVGVPRPAVLGPNETIQVGIVRPFH